MASNQYQKKVKPLLKEIEQWFRNGDSEQMVADKLDIGLTTFKAYRKQYPQLEKAVRQGRETQIKNIKLSLYALATGYEETETTVKTIEKLQDGIQKITTTKKTVKAPSLRAATILLSHLDKDWHTDKDNYELKKQAIALRDAQTVVSKDEWEIIS